jgi:hypothetical protein
LSPPNAAKGISDVNCVRLNGTAHKAHSADDGTAPDPGAIKNDATRTNPNIIFDHDTTPASLKPLITNQPSRVSKCMIYRSKNAVSGYCDISSDFNAVAAVKHTARIDHAVFADQNVT